MPNKYLLLLDQTILLHFRSSIDRPLNLPQYPGGNNYCSFPELIVPSSFYRIDAELRALSFSPGFNVHKLYLK